MIYQSSYEERPVSSLPCQIVDQLVSVFDGESNQHRKADESIE